MRLLLATRNEHKLREMARLLPGHEIDALPGEVAPAPETGDTFEDNARIKAWAAARATDSRSSKRVRSTGRLHRR